jgi:hypothetical protein
MLTSRLPPDVTAQQSATVTDGNKQETAFEKPPPVIRTSVSNMLLGLMWQISGNDDDHNSFRENLCLSAVYDPSLYEIRRHRFLLYMLNTTTCVREVRGMSKP